MDDSKDFWNGRVKKYGHTGWADIFIYAYDQQARLRVIENILKHLNLNKSLALDFGTGTGDFSGLLSGYFEKVVAFDTSEAVIKIARKKYGKIKNINFFCEEQKLNIPDNTVDLLLAVTVLDHIMDDVRLIETLKYFYSLLKNSGFLIVLDSACDNGKEKIFYKRFTKFSEWLSIFTNYGFSLFKCYQFYDPVEYPCASYLSYRNSVAGIKSKILKLLIKCGNRKLVDKYLNRLASMHLQGKSDFFWEDTKNSSPIKIMILKKTT